VTIKGYTKMTTYLFRWLSCERKCSQCFFANVSHFRETKPRWGSLSVLK